MNSNDLSLQFDFESTNQLADLQQTVAWPEIDRCELVCWCQTFCATPFENTSFNRSRKWRTIFLKGHSHSAKVNNKSSWSLKTVSNICWSSWKNLNHNKSGTVTITYPHSNLIVLSNPPPTEEKPPLTKKSTKKVDKKQKKQDVYNGQQTGKEAETNVNMRPSNSLYKFPAFTVELSVPSDIVIEKLCVKSVAGNRVEYYKDNEPIPQPLGFGDNNNKVYKREFEIHRVCLII